MLLSELLSDSGSLLLFNWWSPFCGFFLPRDYHNELFFPPHCPCQASPGLANKLPCNWCRNSHLFSLPRVPGSHTTIRVSSSFTALRIICPETPCHWPASAPSEWRPVVIPMRCKPSRRRSRAHPLPPALTSFPRPSSGSFSQTVPLRHRWISWVLCTSHSDSHPGDFISTCF